MIHTESNKLAKMLFLSFFSIFIMNIYAQEIKPEDIDNIVALSNKIRACEISEHEVMDSLFPEKPHVLFQKEGLNNIALSFFTMVYVEGIQPNLRSYRRCFFVQRKNICRGDLVCRYIVSEDNLLKHFAILLKIEHELIIEALIKDESVSVLFGNNENAFKIETISLTKNEEILKSLLDSVMLSDPHIRFRYEIEFIYTILTSHIQTENDYSALDNLTNKIVINSQNIPNSILYSVIFKLKTNYKDTSQLDSFLKRIKCDESKRILLENYINELNSFYNPDNKYLFRERFAYNPVRHIIKEISLYKDPNMIKLLEKYSLSEKAERKIQLQLPPGDGFYR